MKKISDIAFIIQARLDSKRIPEKMIRPFAGTNLFEIAIQKLVDSKLIPNSNIFTALYDPELQSIAENYPINIFLRDEESVGESQRPSVVSSWHKLPYKHFVSINSCLPLLTTNTIDSFTNYFLRSRHKSLFAVHSKKNFYWDEEGEMITPYPGTMNTNLVDTTYEAAHALYAGSMDDIANDIYLGDFSPNYPELFIVEEQETFDIDHLWQFKMGEVLYENRKRLQ